MEWGIKLRSKKNKLLKKTFINFVIKVNIKCLNPSYIIVFIFLKFSLYVVKVVVILYF